MSERISTSPPRHNASCETAEQANCHCHCRGAGHQKDLITRTATCSDSADYTTLRKSLGKVFGGFHKNARDTITPTRSARKVPSQSEISSLSLKKLKGATWHETLLVDEALHATFIKLAEASLRSNDAVRRAQNRFIEKITHDAISVVGSEVTLTRVVEAHVWCSIVSEFLAGFSASTASTPTPRDFADICYPRKTQGGNPSSLVEVRSQGIQHLTDTFRTTRDVSEIQKIDFLKLVGAATCPDLWRHAAAVRYCLSPFVHDTSWPPENTTTIAVLPDFRELQVRWNRKGHW